MRMSSGLGPFMLVRVTAVTIAWVHEQCARWSPEVWEEGDGELMVHPKPCPTAEPSPARL